MTNYPDIHPKWVKPDDLGGPHNLFQMGLTLIHPFWGEKERFDRLWDNWHSFAPEIKEALEIVLVDDHGNPSVMDMLTNSKRKRIDINLSIYRILDDMKWSTPCALNLGLMVSATPWSLIMDSDCTFLPDDMYELMKLCPRPEVIYKFERNRITEDSHLKKTTRFLPCTMLQHKDLFLGVNGFDEDFCGSLSGGYGFFDNHYDGKTNVWAGAPHRVTRIKATEWMEDVVGPKVQRHKSHEKVNRKLMYAKWDGAVSNAKDMLRFRWERVYRHRR